jgi:hypothetical protein
MTISKEKRNKRELSELNSSKREFEEKKSKTSNFD